MIKQVKRFQAEKDKTIFTFRPGFKFFLKSNALLLIINLIFLINFNRWNGYGGMLLFSLQAEVLIILLSFINCFKNSKPKVQYKQENGLSQNEWAGLLVAIIFVCLFSLFFIGADVPFPSTIIILLVLMNFMAALYSVIFHSIAIGLYKANVYDTSGTTLGYIFKYIAILFSGVNYFVQITLLKLPIIISKLLSILFVLFLLWQTAMILITF